MPAVLVRLETRDGGTLDQSVALSGIPRVGDKIEAFHAWVDGDSYGGSIYYLEVVDVVWKAGDEADDCPEVWVTAIDAPPQRAFVEKAFAALKSGDHA